MNATCGPSGEISLRSADLQSSLESKLRQKTGVDGSILYRLTWKHWELPSGRRICALRGSSKRISVKGYILSGWPTSCSQDGPNGGPGQGMDRFPGAVSLASWPTTTTTRDYKDGQECPNVEINSLLGREVWLAGWQSPNTMGGGATSRGGDRINELLLGGEAKATQLSGWGTPVANPDNKSPEAHLRMKQRMGERDGSNSNRTAITDMAVQAQLVGWNTPTCPVNTDGHQAGNNRFITTTQPFKGMQFCIRGKLQSDGSMLIGSCAEILPESQAGGPLNPEHSRWLMGFPPEWASCAPTVTRSTGKRRKISAKPSGKSAGSPPNGAYDL